MGKGALERNGEWKGPYRTNALFERNGGVICGIWGRGEEDKRVDDGKGRRGEMGEGGKMRYWWGRMEGGGGEGTRDGDGDRRWRG